LVEFTRFWRCDSSTSLSSHKGLLRTVHTNAGPLGLITRFSRPFSVLLVYLHCS
jgi:hypothetical protein